MGHCSQASTCLHSHGMYVTNSFIDRRLYFCFPFGCTLIYELIYIYVFYIYIYIYIYTRNEVCYEMVNYGRANGGGLF